MSQAIRVLVSSFHPVKAGMSFWSSSDDAAAICWLSAGSWLTRHKVAQQPTDTNVPGGSEGLKSAALFATKELERLGKEYLDSNGYLRCISTIGGCGCRSEVDLLAARNGVEVDIGGSTLSEFRRRFLTVGDIGVGRTSARHDRKTQKSRSRGCTTSVHVLS